MKTPNEEISLGWLMVHPSDTVWCSWTSLTMESLLYAHHCHSNEQWYYFQCYFRLLSTNWSFSTWHYCMTVLVFTIISMNYYYRSSQIHLRKRCCNSFLCLLFQLLLLSYSCWCVCLFQNIHFIYGTDFKMTKRIEEEILTNDIIMTHQKMSFCHKFSFFKWKSVEDQ